MLGAVTLPTCIPLLHPPNEGEVSLPAPVVPSSPFCSFLVRCAIQHLCPSNKTCHVCTTDSPRDQMGLKSSSHSSQWLLIPWTTSRLGTDFLPGNFHSRVWIDCTRCCTFSRFREHEFFSCTQPTTKARRGQRALTAATFLPHRASQAGLQSSVCSLPA